MTDTVHHTATPHAGTPDRNLGTRTHGAFVEQLARAMLTEGALDPKTKQLIAVAVAHLTHCTRCIDGHTGLAGRAGATPQDIAEAIWVAAEIQAGDTFVHPGQAGHRPPTSTPTRRPEDDRGH
jgi:AhpD family alkylhydroperoxidase